MQVCKFYIRALVVNFPMFIVFTAWLWHREIEPGLLGLFVAIVLGSFLNLVAVLLVGMVLRKQNDVCAWWKIGLVSLACWITLMLLAVHMMPSL